MKSATKGLTPRQVKFGRGIVKTVRVFMDVPKK
jgi:hypothetical protein